MMNYDHIYYDGIFLAKEDVRLWGLDKLGKTEKEAVESKLRNILGPYAEGNIQGETGEILEGWIKEFCKCWHMLIAIQERIQEEKEQQELASIEEQLI